MELCRNVPEDWSATTNGWEGYLEKPHPDSGDPELSPVTDGSVVEEMIANRRPLASTKDNRFTNRLRRKFDAADKWMETKVQVGQRRVISPNRLEFDPHKHPENVSHLLYDPMLIGLFDYL
jgi:hypothetical protein